MTKMKLLKREAEGVFEPDLKPHRHSLEAGGTFSPGGCGEGRLLQQGSQAAGQGLRVRQPSPTPWRL